MKKWTLLTLLLCLISAANHAAQPLLVDVKIIGSSQSPVFEPQNLIFDIEQDYLLVISNDGFDSISFDYGDFGQKVMTRSMQGASSMTQQSVVINPKSKVQWHFSPQADGEYTYHAVNTALNTKGNPGKIIVNKSKTQLTKTESATQADDDVKQDLKEKNANKRRF